MQEEQADQTDEAVEPTAEGTDEAAAEGPSAGDEDTAAAVDMSAAQSAGSPVLAEPEVPDDANDKIAAAQEHINKLNMDAEREAAERAAKNT
jgi:hypothetical protein